MFPRLFHIGSFYLPTYGVLVASGVLIGILIGARNAEKQGINGDDAWNFGILVVLAGIIGAKILYVINDWSDYANNWREIFSLNTLQAGGVFSGGLIGAFLMAAWYMRRHRMPVARTTDCLRSRTSLWPRPRAFRLLLGWLLLRQTDQSLLGRHFYQSLGECR